MRDILPPSHQGILERLAGAGSVKPVLRARLELEAARCLDDDGTDEDAFAVGEPLVPGVRLGPGRSRAPWRLEPRAHVGEVMARLLSLRERRLGR